ncbi:YbaK/EbsC family protein [Weissella paramesenteroides]
MQLSRSKLGFANEMDLADVLGLKPGFVTPLGLPHDEQNQVTVLLDKELQKVDSIGIHPNSNTATVFVTYEDLLKIIKCSHHQMMIVDLD